MCLWFYLGMLVLPITRTLSSRPKPTEEIFSIVAPAFPWTVSKHSILAIDNESNTLQAANVLFPPPMVSFPTISPSATDWLTLVKAQGHAIEPALLKSEIIRHLASLS